MWLLLAFIAVPLIEIGLFIKVGGWLTLWPTLGIVLLTGIIGTMLVRQQGLKVLGELRNSMAQMRDPLSPLAHGALILFAGALLLTPGFFTDAVGFALLVPPLRRAIIAAVAARVQVASFSAGQAPSPGPYRDAGRDDVIEAEYEDLTEDRPQTPPNKRPSGWTEH
ncbi:FxsA family protein [Pseudorhodobacter sp. E13]|uniref:FxsA family protein n=1 Tax=Pseudorhodobacter sp. E13 TaxID=2487931 RepID=UPI000F8DF01F|nr:FxsA family protein [Pseudorhodobacter sp. E13]RUS59572.1 FxsA family protein [Pseudorhodobacter sp. E13]